MSEDEEDLDVDEPCFGEFHCKQCDRHWHSTKAWANRGQCCRKCKTLAYPDELKKNFMYICDECNVYWNSDYSQEKKLCKTCGFRNVKGPLDPDDWNDRQIIKKHKKDHEGLIFTNENGEHKQDLCQKCRETGGPCREAVNNMKRTPLTTKILGQGDHSKNPTNQRLRSMFEWNSDDDDCSVCKMVSCFSFL